MPIYNYNTQIQPPAPLVYLQVGAPETQDFISIPALLDTGADMTMLPASAFAALQLKHGDEVEIEGATGLTEIIGVSVVQIAIRGLPPVNLAVGNLNLETYSIVGRDYLNRYRISFDGPNLKLLIEE